MQKLIKINEGHYIVVDDSEIKEDDLVLNPLNEIQTYFKDYNFVESKKITHSTQPLEEVKLLSLSEVEEAINGYNVEKMAEIKYGGLSSRTMCGDDYVDREIRCYTEGFNAHKELVKDKLFTVEDMLSIWCFAWNQIEKYKNGEKHQDFNDIIQSLFPKSEWDVTFDEQGKLKLI